jgi:hypothetical protein
MKRLVCLRLSSKFGPSSWAVDACCMTGVSAIETAMAHAVQQGCNQCIWVEYVVRCVPASECQVVQLAW